MKSEVHWVENSVFSEDTKPCGFNHKCRLLDFTPRIELVVPGLCQVSRFHQVQYTRHSIHYARFVLLALSSSAAILV